MFQRAYRLPVHYWTVRGCGEILLRDKIVYEEQKYCILITYLILCHKLIAI